MFISTNIAASKSIILSCIIFFYKKLKNCSIQSFKECLFFVFYLFCFLLLFNNTLHVMFYTYICYCNIFHNKYIIQITFHVVRQFHARVTSKDICLLFIIFFSYFRFILTFFISWSSPLLHCLIDHRYRYTYSEMCNADHFCKNP